MENFYNFLNNAKKTIASKRKGIFIYFVSIILTYYITIFLVSLHSSANIYIEQIQPYLEEDFSGLYLPIYYSNIGNKEVTNLQFKIKTCMMEREKTFKVDDVPANSDKSQIKFYDEVTIQSIKEEECGLRERNKSMCKIETFIYNDEVFAPSQDCTIYSCNPCNYTIKISGNGYEKEVTGSFLIPFKYIYEAVSFEDIDLFKKKYENVSESPLNPYSAFYIGFANPNEICIIEMDGDCDYSTSFLNPEYLFIIEMPPKNKSLNTAHITIFQRYPNDFYLLRELSKKITTGTD